MHKITDYKVKVNVYLRKIAWKERHPQNGVVL